MESSDFLLKAIFESAPDAMIVADSNGSISMVNEQVEKLFGYKKNELTGKQVELLIPHRYHEIHPQHRKHFFTDPKVRGMGVGLELYGKRKDGLEFPVEISLSPMQTTGGILALAAIRDITERKKSEMRQAMLATIVDSTDDAIISKTLGGLITSWNNGAEKIFGYSAKEALGKNISILIPPDRIDEERRIIEKIKENGHIKHYETKRIRKDGKVIDISLTVSPIKDSTGTIVAASKIGRDITEKKQSDEKFKGLMESAPDAMVMVGKDGKIQMVNAQTEKLFKYSREELIGNKVELLIPDRYRKIHPQHRSGFFADPKVRGMGIGLELYGQKKDGVEFPIEISLSPLETPEGTLALAAIRDITERKKSEEKFKGLLESAPDAMVIVGQNGRVQMVNAQTEKLFKYSREEIIGNKVELLIPERYQHAHSKHRQGFFADPKVRRMGIGLELHGKQKEGFEFPIEISLSPLETPEGTLVLAAIRDITDRKKAEEKIKNLNEELEQRIIELESFSYSVSHDLRAPLRAIDGFVSIFNNKYFGMVDGEGKRLLGNIQRNVHKMGRLIDELLTLSRIGMKDIQITDINMEDLVHVVLDELTDTKGNTKIELKELGVSKGDLALIKQVWVNLISNGFKYSVKKENPEIEIGAFSKNKEKVFYVKDNGVGFDMEYSNKLFGVFQRLHDPQEYQGTGVGLAIVKRIIARHGGQVWAEGAENKGATFYFSLPLEN